MQHEQGGMTVVEFIGFIVSLFAMLYLILKQFLDEMKKKRDPKGYAEQQKKREQALKELMGDWGGVPQNSKRMEEEEIEEEEDEMMPVSSQKSIPFGMPPRFPTQAPVKQPLKPMPAGAAGSRQGNNLTSDYFTERHGSFEYEVQRLSQESRGAALVNQFPTRKELFIIKEILDKPIALREEM